jgi:hypothetical protein
MEWVAWWETGFYEYTHSKKPKWIKWPLIETGMKCNNCSLPLRCLCCSRQPLPSPCRTTRHGRPSSKNLWPRIRGHVRARIT